VSEHGKPLVGPPQYVGMEKSAPLCTRVALKVNVGTPPKTPVTSSEAVRVKPLMKNHGSAVTVQVLPDTPDWLGFIRAEQTAVSGDALDCAANPTKATAIAAPVIQFLMYPPPDFFYSFWLLYYRGKYRVSALRSQGIFLDDATGMPRGNDLLLLFLH